MEIHVEIKYPGAGLGTLKPFGPLHSIKATIGWLERIEERVIKPAIETVPLPIVRLLEDSRT